MGRARGGFRERILLTRPCPAVPRRGPEAGDHHILLIIGGPVIDQESTTKTVYFS